MLNSSTDVQRPYIWLLLGAKAGDNNQVITLAKALDWPYQIKQFSYHRYELLCNRLLRITLTGINKADRAQLQPPWPDLIITAGRRNEPVARWIVRAAGKHGKAVKLVHIGRPWAPLNVFDLIITTPQYFLPRQANILHNQLPLHNLSSERLTEAAQQWRSTFADLPKPYAAVMIGGNSGFFALDKTKAKAIGEQLNRCLQISGGSLLITDSARTPAAAFEVLLAQLSVPVFVYRWRQTRQKDNPYFAYLALADRLIVTGESMSMLTEASATGKPLYIIDLTDRQQSWWRYRYHWRWQSLSHRIAMRIAPQRMRRDISRIQSLLVDSGKAMWLHKTSPQQMVGNNQTKHAIERVVANDDLVAAVARVRALFEHDKKLTGYF